MRLLLWMFLFLITSAPLALAVDAPSAQIHINTDQILRGQFTEEHQINGGNGPMVSSGHFVVAPTHGLIWGIEQPFPTSTIITPQGAMQNFGGISMKLPTKNLRHLYDIVGGALMGDWTGLEKDFVIIREGDHQKWSMILTPRHLDNPKLAYTKIIVTGHRFVENIILTKRDGNTDTLGFTEVALSSPPLQAREMAAFEKVQP